MIPTLERLAHTGHAEIVIWHAPEPVPTAYGITQTPERVVEPVQPLEWTGPEGAVLCKTHVPRYPGFIFAFIGFLVLSSAWIRMFQTSSMVGFLEWFAIGTGFFMLAFVRRDWVRSGL